MIARLQGNIIEKTANWIILNVQGVGYRVFCDASQLVIEQSVILFVHHHIRETEQALYGFKTMLDLQLFELLITVNGVGPKAAMAIMSSSSPDRIVSAISKSDVSLFKSVSGIGQKVAAKIIVELKNKVGGVGEIDLGGLDSSSELVEALESLGYKKPEIAAVLRQMPSELSNTQEQLSWALKEMGKG